MIIGEQIIAQLRYQNGYGLHGIIADENDHRQKYVVYLSKHNKQVSKDDIVLGKVVGVSRKIILRDKIYYQKVFIEVTKVIRTGNEIHLAGLKFDNLLDKYFPRRTVYNKHYGETFTLPFKYSFGFKVSELREQFLAGMIDIDTVDSLFRKEIWKLTINK